MSHRKGRSSRRRSLSYSKSYKVGKHLRVNVSKRGVGYSYGVKGFRVSHGPRGKHLNIGRGGFRYRQRLDNAQPTMTPAQTGIALLIILPILLITKPTLAVLVLLVGIPTFLVWGVYKAITARQNVGEAEWEPQKSAPVNPNAGKDWDGWVPNDNWDTDAQSTKAAEKAPPPPRVKVTYQEDSNFYVDLLLLNAFVEKVGQAQKSWVVSHVEVSTNFKSAAGTVLRRNTVRVDVFDERHKESKDFQVNAPMYLLTQLGSPQGNIILAPGLIILDPWLGRGEPKLYRVVDLLPQVKVTRFLETEVVPSDARSVGQTWLYVNKDGSPDRRYRDNQVVPIVEYGELTFSLREEPQTIVLRLQISSVNVAEELYQICDKGFNTQTDDAQGRESQSNAETSDSKPPRVTSPYDVLGVKPDATNEEIRQAFRILTKKYHPDRVAHLGTEFRELAEVRMKEINAAYSTILNKFD